MVWRRTHHTRTWLRAARHALSGSYGRTHDTACAELTHVGQRSVFHVGTEHIYEGSKVDRALAWRQITVDVGLGFQGLSQLQLSRMGGGDVCGLNMSGMIASNCTPERLSKKLPLRLTMYPH